MRVERLPSGPPDPVTRLSADLLGGHAPSLPDDPGPVGCDPAAILRRAVPAAGHARARREVADAAAAYQERIGAPAEARGAAGRLGEPGAVAIVAGQGPGLLGGPAMSLYKGLAAVLLARRMQREAPERSWIPVFWNASQDHDAAEHGVAHLLSGGRLRSVRAPLEGAGRPLDEVPAGPAAAAAIDAFGALLPEGEPRARLAALGRPAPDDTVGSWASRILSRLLGPLGLVVVEPIVWDALARPLLEEALARAGDLEAAVARQTGVLASAGYAPAVPQASSCVMGSGPGPRRRVGSAREATRLTPDVLLRPVVQGALLPVAAQVSGPSEIAYAAQVAPLFRALGIPSPCWVPRMSLTLVDGRMAASMRRLGVPASECLVQGEDVASWTARHVDPGAAAEIASAREAVDQAVTRLEAQAVATEPGADGAFRRGRARVGREFERLARLAEEASARAGGHDPGTLRALRESFRPGGRPQERVLTYAGLWAIRPGDLTAEIEAAADPLETKHQVLYLDG